MIFIRSISLFFILIIISCNQKSKSNLSALLNHDHLASQVFTIDISRDTILMTTNGCIIKIPEGSIESKSRSVKLEIKEALNLTDIVLAGLTTMSGQNALSSGGMIYFNAAAGYEITIKKDIEVLIPTKNYNPDMQVFKGEEESDGSIDWNDPVPLPPDEMQKEILAGQGIFKANCANCHKLEEDFTGPALLGVTDRRSKEWLYSFTRRPDMMIMGTGMPGETGRIPDFTRQDPDYYSQCLKNKWKVMMTSFPVLSDPDLDAIYSYIKVESDKRPDLKEKYKSTCCDSCEIYWKAINSEPNRFPDSTRSSEELFDLDRKVTIPIMNETVLSEIRNNDSSLLFTTVSETQTTATYYSIDIQATGWYNIDILLKEISNCVPSELFVRVQGSFDVDLSVVLVIPSVKAFVRGGKLKDGKLYGFDENDGRIPLPQNARSYIMAFAEYGDNVIFGKAEFSTQLNQTIEITLSEISKTYMEFQIKKLDLEGVSMTSEKIKIAPANTVPIPQPKRGTEEAEKNVNDFKHLLPKNCDCDFLYDPIHADGYIEQLNP